MASLTRRELDQLTCSEEKCQNTACTGELYFYGACHPQALPRVSYFSGAMTVQCSVCGQPIAVVAVKDE